VLRDELISIIDFVNILNLLVKNTPAMLLSQQKYVLYCSVLTLQGLDCCNHFKIIDK